jgi:hypothetical protein
MKAGAAACFLAFIKSSSSLIMFPKTKLLGPRLFDFSLDDPFRDYEEAFFILSI